MDRREILNELHQIVAIADNAGSKHGISEIAQRAIGLIREVERWPAWLWPNGCDPAADHLPAPFVSDQCCERHHGDCQLGSANQPFTRLCHCACHCPPEAPQQPAEPAPLHDCHAAPDAPQQPAEPTPLAERHIDTPDELLELLAGVSSDPQIEGLSLAQKASTMALLYAAKALQEIAGHVEDIDTALELVGGTWLAKAAQSPDSPVEPS